MEEQHRSCTKGIEMPQLKHMMHDRGIVPLGNENASCLSCSDCEEEKGRKRLANSSLWSKCTPMQFQSSYHDSHVALGIILYDHKFGEHRREVGPVWNGPGRAPCLPMASPPSAPPSTQKRFMRKILNMKIAHREVFLCRMIGAVFDSENIPRKPQS